MHWDITANYYLDTQYLYVIYVKQLRITNFQLETTALISIMFLKIRTILLTTSIRYVYEQYENQHHISTLEQTKQVTYTNSILTTMYICDFPAGSDAFGQ